MRKKPPLPQLKYKVIKTVTDFKNSQHNIKGFREKRRSVMKKCLRSIYKIETCIIYLNLQREVERYSEDKVVPI